VALGVAVPLEKCMKDFAFARGMFSRAFATSRIREEP